MPCPECQSPGHLWYRSVGSEFSFYRCGPCQLIYRDPALWHVIDYSRYGKKQKDDWAIASPGAESRAHHLHQKLHDALSQASAALCGKIFLEIGCGPGLLLNRLVLEYPSAEIYGLARISHDPPAGTV